MFMQSCSTMASYEAKRKAELQLQKQALETEKNQQKQADTSVEDAKAAAAAKLLAEQDPLAGLQLPELPAVLKTSADIKLVLAKYKGFSVSAQWVMQQVQAFGLRPQLKNIQVVRAAAAYWNTYFSTMQVYPDKPVLKKPDLDAFYTQLATIDTVATSSVKILNETIDKERSRAWVLGNINQPDSKSN